MEPKIPSCQEVPGTRLTGGCAPSSRIPSCYDPQDDQPKEGNQQQPKLDALSTKSRPTKPERTLCKSLARMAFLFHQANGLQDIAQAEKMLICSLQGARADQRSSEYATTVLHALFAEMG